MGCNPIVFKENKIASFITEFLQYSIDIDAWCKRVLRKISSFYISFFLIVSISSAIKGKTPEIRSGRYIIKECKQTPIYLQYYFQVFENFKRWIPKGFIQRVRNKSFEVSIGGHVMKWLRRWWLLLHQVHCEKCIVWHYESQIKWVTTKAFFTLSIDVDVCVSVKKFNIVSMMILMETHRMGPRPIFCVSPGFPKLLAIQSWHFWRPLHSFYFLC